MQLVQSRKARIASIPGGREGGLRTTIERVRGRAKVVAAILSAMEIARHRHNVATAIPMLATHAIRIERGRAVVLASSPCPQSIALRAGGEVWHVTVQAEQRALVCAGAVPLHLDGAVAAASVPVSTLSRWMAFHDAVAGSDPVAASPRHPLVMASGKSLEQVPVLSAFLFDLLRRDPEMHERLRLRVAAGEHYQIARFVLGEAASSRVGDLAAAYGLSATHFRVRCGEVFGRSAKDQLRELRASRALLRYQGSGTVLSELALEAGYASQSHFSDEIKALVGLSPRHIYKAVHQ
ncbi:helix-turn-helix domain-containing protein [Stenotrophomonas sp. B1-1]|uniref:helix-turn-helix domain-containing protein n=1 Tax=Stenotrophomonas sp. B1-1 TaxID=2710648 RepID=UPI0013D96F66|nr:helix-turn-helix domain-containing protein [Stenotrophomonas sp. B1-1]